jgi:phage-related protein (TIGR01555 family)
MIGQHWLVDKACTMPAEDAVRKGFELTVNDGASVPPNVLAEFEELNKRYRLTQNLIEFARFGRMFGIRWCVFLVDSNDKKYYEKPFNIDGVRPGTYKGMCQVDPYWVVPLLDSEALSNPLSKDYYVPTYWQVGDKLVHKSHIVTYLESEVADYLKPTYLWGGVSVPQKIAERVYGSDRTANEAPLLAMTKRLLVHKTDIDRAIANQQAFTNNVLWATQMRDNYGRQVIDTDEEMQQIDTTLTDMDALIMTQYQIVAAIAGVPSTKLLGTTPKGFNATGEYEMASYHEMLESMQSNHLTPLVDRHIQLLLRSEIMPKFGGKEYRFKVKWEPLKTATAEEIANVNKLNAEADLTLSQTGAIDGTDVQNRLISDPDSGYNGIERHVVEQPDDLEQPESGNEEKPQEPENIKAR